MFRSYTYGIKQFLFFTNKSFLSNTYFELERITLVTTINVEKV